MAEECKNIQFLKFSFFLLVKRKEKCFFSSFFKVTVSMGSIPALSDAVESEWAADEAVLNNVHKNLKVQKSPFGTGSCYFCSDLQDGNKKLIFFLLINF